MMLYEPIYHNLQMTNMISVRVSLKLKGSLFFFAKETRAVGENPFAPQLNEKEVLEVLQNPTPGSAKKTTKYGMKIF